MLNITKSNGKVKSLELHLGRGLFASGQHLSGVVMIRLEKPVNIRSISVSLDGFEKPNKKVLPQASSIKFFHRDVLLSGSAKPKSSMEALSKFWKEFLRRDMGKVLSPGEHIYPFFISLPSSIPATYSGWAGEIKYPLNVDLNLIMGKKISIKTFANIIHTPKTPKHIPISASYPKSKGNILPNPMKVNVELAKYSAEVGGVVEGTVYIHNPENIECNSVSVTLDLFEMVRDNIKQNLNSSTTEFVHIEPKDKRADVIESKFSLKVPSDAQPSVEGTAISVVWLLKVVVDSEFPQEIKMPITVYTTIKD
ncbi:MAG: hypothetical protein SNJ70_03875 [Armatimonadota bacterium]